MWSGLFAGVLSSLVAGIVLMLLFSGNEAAIKNWLARRGLGALQRFYVSIFVEAVRGSSRMADTRHLLSLYIIVIGVIFFSFGFCLNHWENVISSGVDAGEKALNDGDVAIQNMLEVLQRDRTSINQSLDDLRGNIAKMKELKETLMLSNEDNRRVLSNLEVAEKIFEFCFFPLFLYFCFWYYPCCTIRASLSFDIERLSLRLQGLASKSELAELTRCEIAVKNRETARLYVHAIHTIADRHSLQSLYRDFPFVNDFLFQEIPKAAEPNPPATE